jgi:hypothetical protein
LRLHPVLRVFRWTFASFIIDGSEPVVGVMSH